MDGEVINLAYFRIKLAREHRISVVRQDCEDIVTTIAQENFFDPIYHYLESVYRTLGGDDSYLDDLCDRYFGVNDPIYTQFLKCTLIGAVARIYKPGCQMENTLILQGGQGLGKTRFYQYLASPEWFDNSLGALSDKDERLKLHRTWFVEWGELEAVFRRKDIAAIKAFLSTDIDTIRKPYGRKPEAMPRRSIIVGSTNQSEFLVDSTGNRRFWVVPVKKQIDIARLKRERDLIWASAVTLYKQGHLWYLHGAIEVQAERVAEAYTTDDPWLDKVRKILRDRTSITTGEILDELDIDNAQQTKAVQMRVSDLLRSLDWEVNRKYVDGKQLRVWEPAQAGENDSPVYPLETYPHLELKGVM